MSAANPATFFLMSLGDSLLIKVKQEFNTYVLESIYYYYIF